ncbi:MAG: YqgE/AlgH family protein [Ekhidna sp.]|nr:YqgE/AlgH family protein [Ekhidna sp.]
MDFFVSKQVEKPERGDLLISEPYLPDPNFERTVIYLCKHDENDTFGLVLNKKTNVKLGDIVDEVADYPAELFVGGPVQQNTMHFIHRNIKLAESARLVQNEIYWGGDYDLLTQMLNARSIFNGDIRFFIGYSGWVKGQLMDEVKKNSWIILKRATQEVIFEWDNQELWRACLKTMGGKYRLMSNYPKDPRMN